MWYLYSLIISYMIGMLTISQINNRAIENGTPLSDKQIKVISFLMVVLMTIPLFNIVWSVTAVSSTIFDKDYYYKEIDDLIDNVRSII